MIVEIIEGMTPAEYISAINANLSGVLLEAYTPVTEEMTTIELQDNINANLTKELSVVGVRGSSLVSLVNSAFTDYGFSGDTPTAFEIESVEDFTQISFTDQSGGNAKHEIWQSKDSGEYELYTTLNEGVSSYDYVTYQMEHYKFRIRSKRGNTYSTFTDVLSILTPLVFFTNQVESFRDILFRQIKLDDVSSIDIIWGDGEETLNYTPVGNVYEEVGHTYTVAGTYWIHIKGAVDKFSVLQFYEQPVEGTNIEMWIWRFSFCHLWSNGFIGDVSNIDIPLNIGGMHLANNNDLTGNFNKLFAVEHPNLWDTHIPFGGDGESWVFGAKQAHLEISNSGAGDLLTGDISGWRFPKNNDYQSWLISLRGTPTGDISLLFDGEYQYLHTIELPSLGLDGDLSGWFIGADYGYATSIDINGNNFTKLPRGNFYKFGEYRCNNNNCNQSEIDAILSEIETSVTANAPEYDCEYILNGTGMGIPSAAGLASKASIEGKYAAAGKSITIYVNS